jgi:hypothetical protein
MRPVARLLVIILIAIGTLLGFHHLLSSGPDSKQRDAEIPRPAHRSARSETTKAQSGETRRHSPVLLRLVDLQTGAPLEGRKVRIVSRGIVQNVTTGPLGQLNITPTKGSFISSSENPVRFNPTAIPPILEPDGEIPVRSIRYIRVDWHITSKEQPTLALVSTKTGARLVKSAGHAADPETSLLNKALNGDDVLPISCSPGTGTSIARLPEGQYNYQLIKVGGGWSSIKPAHPMWAGSYDPTRGATQLPTAYPHSGPWISAKLSVAAGEVRTVKIESKKPATLIIDKSLMSAGHVSVSHCRPKGNATVGIWTPRKLAPADQRGNLWKVEPCSPGRYRVEAAWISNGDVIQLGFHEVVLAPGQEERLTIQTNTFGRQFHLEILPKDRAMPKLEPIFLRCEPLASLTGLPHVERGAAAFPIIGLHKGTYLVSGFPAFEGGLLLRFPRDMITKDFDLRHSPRVILKF